MVLLSSGCKATFEGLSNVQSSSTTHNSGRATSRIAIARAMSAKFKEFSFVVIPLFRYSTFYQLPKRNRIVDANNTLDTYTMMKLNSLIVCVVHVLASPTPTTFSAATDTLS